MNLADLPLWVQMCSPTSSNELTELRISLSHNEQLKAELERFLHAQWCVLNSKARKELDEDIRKEYQHSAHAIAEIIQRRLFLRHQRRHYNACRQSI